MTDRELMQEALYALTYVGDAKEIYSDTIESLRARLAQPEPEPVAWWHDMGDVVDLNVSGRGVPLYTAPPQREWVGLTDEEMMMIYGQSHEGKKYSLGRAIEAKLKEKNGTI
jgi:hypothetical protein